MNKIFSLDEFGQHFIKFLDIPIPTNHSPNYFDIFSEFKMTREFFCDHANNLFNHYKIRIPKNYPNLKLKDREVLGQRLGTSAWDEFTVCIACCIELENKYKINTEKILKKKLIEPNSRSGILHAESLSSIALHYLKKGFDVTLFPPTTGNKNPDLMIDDLLCEVKVIDEADWYKDPDLETGQTKDRKYSEDLCYDIGTLISKKDSGHKGIKQADIVFADLSYKSFGFLPKIENVEYNGLPDLHKHRMIFFSKKITQFCSYYIDFQKELWSIIKNSTKKHSFFIAPWNKKKTRLISLHSEA